MNEMGETGVKQEMRWFICPVNSCRSRQEEGVGKHTYALDEININSQLYPDGVISQLSFYNTWFGGKMVNFCTGSYL